MASAYGAADSSLPAVTPPQLCLLALVQFYLNAAHSAHTHAAEQPTGAKIDHHTTRWILQLVNEEQLDTRFQASSLKQWLQSVQHHANARRRVQPAIVRDALQEVLTVVEGIASPHDLRTLLHAAYAHVIEYDTANAATVVTDGQQRVDRWSVLGVFIRQCYVPVELGGFQALVDLFDEVVTFQQSTPDDNTAGNTPSLVSSHSIDPISREAFQGRKPEVQALVSSADNSSISAIDLSITNKQYDESIQRLTQYHDQHHNHQQARHAATAAQATNNVSYVQYALLHLSMLQCHYGYHQLAIHTVQECINLAQYVNDQVCLYHAMNLVTKITEQHKTFATKSESRVHSDTTSLAPQHSLTYRCVVAQLQSSVHTIKQWQEYKHKLAVQQQKHANQQQQANEIVQPLEPIASIDAQSYAAFAQLQIETPDSNYQPNAATPLHRDRAAGQKTSLASPQIASVWYCLQQSNILNLNSNLIATQYCNNALIEYHAMQCYGQHTLAAALAQSSLAYHSHHQSSTVSTSLLCSLAQNKIYNDEQQAAILQYVVEQYPTLIDVDGAQLEVLLLQFNRAYDESKIQLCHQLYHHRIAPLMSTLHSRLQPHSSLYLQCCLASAKLNTLYERFETAVQECTSVISVCKMSSNHYVQLQATVLYVRIMCQVDEEELYDGDDESTATALSSSAVTMLALPTLLSGLSLAQSIHAASMTAELTVLLAYIQLRTGGFAVARRALRQVYPTVLERCSQTLQQEADRLLQHANQLDKVYGKQAAA